MIAARSHGTIGMENHATRLSGRTVLSIGVATILALTLAGCMSAEERRQANLYADTGTCEAYGADYGSCEHAECMLQQQHRRDQRQLMNLEKARIASETARNNMEIIEAIRERRRLD
ncbi:UNVERIFIED_CONTAM: hypothetical protein Q9R58_05595 [Methylobacteriaceae bacterium AG10]|nr:hypothetical protein [Methylobacteriaceae bacterium AG10]